MFKIRSKSQRQILSITVLKVNTQVLPQYFQARRHEASISRAAGNTWDVHATTVCLSTSNIDV